MKASKHFGHRAQKRVLKQDTLQFILDWGTEIRRAGAIFLIVLEDTLPAYISEQMKEAVRDRAVVLADDGSTLLTTYKRADVLRYVKRKSKRSERSRTLTQSPSKAWADAA